MRQIPILFSTPMVQAILSGKKTQTRRIVNPQPDVDFDSGYVYWDNHMFDIHMMPLSDDLPKLARWQPGDILWVRETWRKNPWPTGWPYEYLATAKQDMTPEDGPWKPSIHMPRAACRLFLKVKDVRVEVLGDITEEDAIAEGVGAGFQLNAGYPDYQHIKNGVCELTQDTAVCSFVSLWESIHGTCSWEKQPWVWVIEFERVEL